MPTSGIKGLKCKHQRIQDRSCSILGKYFPHVTAARILSSPAAVLKLSYPVLFGSSGNALHLIWSSLAPLIYFLLLSGCDICTGLQWTLGQIWEQRQKNTNCIINAIRRGKKCGLGLPWSCLIALYHRHRCVPGLSHKDAPLCVLIHALFHQSN